MSSSACLAKIIFAMFTMSLMLICLYDSTHKKYIDKSIKNGTIIDYLKFDKYLAKIIIENYF